MAVGTRRALGSRLKRVNEPISVERFQQATAVAAIQPWIERRWRFLADVLSTEYSFVLFTLERSPEEWWAVLVVKSRDCNEQ